MIYQISVPAVADVEDVLAKWLIFLGDQSRVGRNAIDDAHRDAVPDFI